jgi:tRNA A37 threonylcarbamoyladenosine synthetase subunit TsaC/SUA5/YrdC
LNKKRKIIKNEWATETFEIISDRPEREGFANLVRDLIEARELTANLVARAVEVTKRFWPTEVLIVADSPASEGVI